MTLRPFLRSARAAAALAVLVLVGMLITFPRGQAYGEQNDEADGALEIKRGFAIAPVKLNLEGKNRDLVGLGSF